MTIMEVVEIIEETAEKQGFIVERNSEIGFPKIILADDAFAKINVWASIDYTSIDLEKGVAIYEPEILIETCRRFATYEPEEMLAAAEQMRRIAELAGELKRMNLFYEVPMEDDIGKNIGKL